MLIYDLVFESTCFVMEWEGHHLETSEKKLNVMIFLNINNMESMFT